MAAEVTRLDTNQHINFQGHKTRTIDFNIISSHAIPFQMFSHIFFEIIVYRQPSQAINCHKDCTPATCPTESGGSALHPWMTFRHLGVIIRSDSPLLNPESTWCALAHLLYALRFYASPCW